MSPRAVRLGAVSFLNARPLTVGLDGPDSPFELHHDLPSRCAAELAAGHIDVGLIPAIEYARNDPDYWRARLREVIRPKASVV